MKDTTIKSIYSDWNRAGAHLKNIARAEKLRLIKAQISLHPELEDDILLSGLAGLMRVWAVKFAKIRRQSPAYAAQISAQKERYAQEFARIDRAEREQREKAASFDRIVEMLDHQMVGTKLLGDCTKADLLRAAVSAEQTAGEMTLQAGFYRLLADIVPQGQTVRQANDRGKIVALLTHQFRSE